MRRPSDESVGVVIKFGAGLLAVTALVFLAVAWMFGVLDERARASMRPPPPMAERGPRVPPEPRLEVSPGVTLRRIRAREDEILSSYGWVDRDAGVVRIPIDRAMDLVAGGRRPEATEEP
ncbi:MAG: hypothetical protein HYY06_25935 [Deltaproteobacteria bacterium]|nr:hypothetical protein [Deltaproteobacteria bacterium]